MRDQAQLNLQNAEREFCSTLNALAGCLLKKAEAAKAASGRLESGADGVASSSNPKGARKKPRGAGAGVGADTLPGTGRKSTSRSKLPQGDGVEAAAAAAVAGGSGAPSSTVSMDLDPDRIRREALDLLECSFRVGEWGIDAADSSRGGTEGGGGDPSQQQQQQPEDIKASDGSIRAWRFVQVWKRFVEWV